MAVHIRLRKIGKRPKKNPHFRITVYHHTRSRDGRFIEEIGFYNPISNAMKVKKERLDFWIKNGAQLSLTVKSIIKKLNKEAGAEAIKDKGGQ